VNIIRRMLFFGLVITLASCSATQAKKQDGSVHYMLGGSYLQEGNATGALKEFLLAAEADPNNADIQAALGQAFHMKQAYGEAETHYLKALSLKKDDPQVQNNLGALYLDMKRWDKAIEYFRRASSNLLFQDPEVALTGMGVAQFNLGRYLDAVESYKLALHDNPNYPQAHFHLGEAYYALDKVDLAVQEYQAALRLAPNFVQAHYRLAMTYMRLHQVEKARTEFLVVVRLAPESDQARLAKDYLAILN
jgi:tetratricopeptide (TPR) repeat protein